MKNSNFYWNNWSFASRLIPAVVILFLFVVFWNIPAYSQMVAGGSMSHSSYAIDAQGVLYAWGQNNHGQLGNGTTVNDSTPVMVPFPSGVTKWLDVTAGDSHALAIGNNGNLYAWGYNNKGQLGNGTTSDTSLPAMVTKPTGVTSWTAIAGGSSISFAIGNDGHLYSWGYNNFGQLGNGTTKDTSLPAMVSLPTGVTATAVSAAANSAIAIGSDGILYAWGRNGNGQLGNGTKNDNTTPDTVNVPVGVTPVAVSSGAYFNSFLGNDGNIYGFGQGNNGQIGNGTLSGDALGGGNYGTPTPANLPNGVTSWKSYATGASFVLAIASNDSLYAFGYNGTGELGVVTGTSNNPNPLNVVFPADVSAMGVAAGHNHGFIFDNNNNSYAWGRNVEGQLGVNNLTNQPTPIEVVGVGASGNLVLPVELTSFSAIVSSNVVTLRWTTATEINNKGFEVEKKIGNSWIALGFVQGKGNSTIITKYFYTDNLGNFSGSRITYRLKQINFDGTAKYSNEINVSIVDGPKEYSISQNYPNPFNPTTTIKYALPFKSHVRISVYNITGSQVKVLINSNQSSGEHQVEFSAASSLSSGVYFYKIEASSLDGTHSFNETKKLILLK